jgi:hypothetical protein
LRIDLLEVWRCDFQAGVSTNSGDVNARTRDKGWEKDENERKMKEEAVSSEEKKRPSHINRRKLRGWISGFGVLKLSIKINPELAWSK